MCVWIRFLLPILGPLDPSQLFLFLHFFSPPPPPPAPLLILGLVIFGVIYLHPFFFFGILLVKGYFDPLIFIQVFKFDLVLSPFCCQVCILRAYSHLLSLLLGSWISFITRHFLSSAGFPRSCYSAYKKPLLSSNSYMELARVI